MALPVIYSMDMSPPCRGVLLAVAAAGIKIDVQQMNMHGGQNLKEEFLKMNPQHTIPTMNDNGFAIGESHAIVTYLVDKYAKDDSLYPKDLQKRALVNHRLHFNNATLFNNLKSIKHVAGTGLPQDRIDAINESYGFLEKFLGDNDWLAGDSYTLADTSTIATVSSLTAIVPLDKYPKLAAWAKRCEDQIPGYATANAPGAAALRSIIQNYVIKK